MRVAGMRAASEAGNTSKNAPSIIERREPRSIEVAAEVAERVAQAKALKERLDSYGETRLAGSREQLGPAYDRKWTEADNHASKLHTEIKIDGKVIGRIYSSGVAEFADEYAYLAKDFKGETLSGPELAEERLAKVKESLKRTNTIITDDKNAVSSNTGRSVAEILRAGTAQSQTEWLAFKATESSIPGQLLSRTA